MQLKMYNHYCICTVHVYHLNVNSYHCKVDHNILLYGSSVLTCQLTVKLLSTVSKILQVREEL